MTGFHFWVIVSVMFVARLACQMSGLLTNRNIQASPIKTKQKEHFCFAKEPPSRLSQRRDRFHYAVIEHWGSERMIVK